MRRNRARRMEGENIKERNGKSKNPIKVGGRQKIIGNSYFISKHSLISEDFYWYIKTKQPHTHPGRF